MEVANVQNHYISYQVCREGLSQFSEICLVHFHHLTGGIYYSIRGLGEGEAVGVVWC